MASEFLQMVVVVELRNPPERLHGSVTGVEAGQSLTLSNVWSLNHGTWKSQVIVDPTNILEIFDASKDSNISYLTPPPPLPLLAYLPDSAPTSTPTAVTPVLGDPAILSFRPRPARPDSSPDPHRSATRIIADTNSILPLPHKAHAAPTTYGQNTSQDVLEVKAHLPNTDHESAQMENIPCTAGTSPYMERQEGGLKARRRLRQNRSPKNVSVGDAVVSAPDHQQQAGRGKGWRKTPMLESTASFQPFNSLKKSGQRHQQANQSNGWASEDVTDVQELGDFDFQESLAKFDKRTLFDKMRLEDQINEADRLVTHNRMPIPKAGTSGGRNLHYSENVLDIPSTPATPKISTKEPQMVSQDFWNSEADDIGAGGGEHTSGLELGSRQSSRRSENKTASNRRSQSRKASSGTAGQGSSRVNSIPAFSLFSNTQSFHVLPSERRLETVSALQMLNLENIAHNELGLTEDMMAENAGRGIAEVALEALGDPAIKIQTGLPEKSVTASSTGQVSHVSPAPTIVVLAGNNKSGARAVAGSRHLRNKGINVLLCVVGIERGEREQLDDLRQQMRLYRNFGGRIYSKGDLFEHLRKVAIPSLTIDAPRSAVSAKVSVVTLIIDALLGLAVSFDELRTGDQATVYELMEWANRNEAFVLAVDVPTGIDPTTGRISIIDGARLYVHPRYVIALGAPKRGLLDAIAAAELGNIAANEVSAADDSPHDWRLFIADIGLGSAVWKKAGTKIRRGIDFHEKWVLEMRYRGISEEHDSG